MSVIAASLDEVGPTCTSFFGEKIMSVKMLLYHTSP